MLDATEEYGNVDERQAAAASSKKERSQVEAAAVKTDHVCNRMVYKLVKVRDDGSVLAATEDDVVQFLVGGPEMSGLAASYDPEASSDAIGEEEDDAGGDCVASDEDDLSCSTGRAKSIPIQDLAVERQRLKAQIEVLDCILMRVDLEERRRLSAEKETVGKMGIPGPTYVNTSGVGPGDSYKRQRRPNPKYFDAVYDPGESDSTLIGPPPTSNSEQTMPRQAISSSRKAQPPRSATTDVVVNSPRRVTSGWGSARHRARSSSLKTTFTRMPSKVNHDIKSTSVSSLDNLSIRELHEAFCSTFGRETSVKDKHWLKRQISAGWLRREQDHDVGQFVRSSTTADRQNKLKARLDSCVAQQAEQPLRTATATVTPASSNQRDRVVNDVFQKTNDHVEHNFSDHAFRSRLGSRCFHRRVTTPAILSTSCIYGEVVNNGEPVVEGKRQRKPNRRYIEDETYVVSRFVPVHETRSFFSGETHHELGNSATNYSWRTVPETDESSEIIARHTRTGSRKFSSIQRPKLISSGMKRKVGGRAAKLVMVAHTTTVARAGSDAAICNAKLNHLPTTPDIIAEDDIMPEMNGDSAAGSDLAGSAIMQKLDQLPEMDEDAQPTGLMSGSKMRSGGVDQVIANSDPDSGQQQQQVVTTTVSTVPTASGGTRRKHHRPWTLREVMTLVEGVARCGGGKWADIKKLAFATVAYRTAVDLKDKWRNLLRASRAQLHPAKQGERKKQFTAAIPAPILSRVRELASLPNQFPSATVTSVSSTSRSGRSIVHRK